jgi:hypothetical protein
MNNYSFKLNNKNIWQNKLYNKIINMTHLTWTTKSILITVSWQLLEEIDVNEFKIIKKNIYRLGGVLTHLTRIH